MGWFENQIEERRSADQQLLEESFLRVADVVMGKRSAERLRDERIITRNAIEEILKYYHCRTPEIPEEIKTAEDQLDYCLRPHGNADAARRRAAPATGIRRNAKEGESR